MARGIVNQVFGTKSGTTYVGTGQGNTKTSSGNTTTALANPTNLTKTSSTTVSGTVPSNSVGNRTTNSSTFSSNTTNAQNALTRGLTSLAENNATPVAGSMAANYIAKYGTGADTGGSGSDSDTSKEKESTTTYSSGSYSYTPVTSLESYIKEMYANNLTAQKASLKSAYEQDIANIDAELAKLPQQYDSARNSTAVQNELARQRFLEQANATGLNSGTSGQAELARSSALQNNLSNIDLQQQNAVDALETQRINRQSEYSAAITQAESENNSALAEALYNEYVRQDEANRELQIAYLNANS